MATVLEINNLNKSFGKRKILNDISLTLDEGKILGFIGPNGSGKTTTIKLILGLQSIDSGEVYINGFSIKKDFEKAIERVGAIVESPDLYMYMTGRKNLELIARMYDGIDNSRIEEVIEISGLGKRIDDKVSKYSLGMRQRLGIAASLLNNPNILILDEPTNGLDPEGIKELRDLLKRLTKEKKVSILISSHNLFELESFITDACIIQNGSIVSNSSIKKLSKLSRTCYEIEVSDITNVDKALSDEIKIIDDNKFEVYVEKEDIPFVIKKLVKKDIDVFSVSEKTMNLEEIFLNETGGNEIDKIN